MYTLIMQSFTSQFIHRIFMHQCPGYQPLEPELQGRKGLPLTKFYQEQVMIYLDPLGCLYRPLWLQVVVERCINAFVLIRSQPLDPAGVSLELAMDDLDPLGVSQSLDPCLEMPHLDSAGNVAYPYPLDFMNVPQEQPELGELDGPFLFRMNRGLSISPHCTWHSRRACAQ